MHIKEINHCLRTYRSFASGNLGGGGYRTMNERLKDLLKRPTAPFANPFVLKDKNNEIFTRRVVTQAYIINKNDMK